MRWETIHKSPAERFAANLSLYKWVRHDFTWAHARTWLAGLPDGGGLNIGYEAVDRHAAGDRRDAIALRFLARDGGRTDITFGTLYGHTSRFANLLDTLGVRSGDRVYSLLGWTPELYTTALGALRQGSVYAALSPGSGTEPARERLRLGDGRVLVTTPELYERRIAPVRAGLPGLRHVLVTGDGPAPPGTTLLSDAVARCDGRYDVAPTDPDRTALLQFTDTGAGPPTAAVHVHEAVVAHYATAVYALDLRVGDVFWCTADPGRMTGTSYGIIAPLAIGATVLVDGREFDAARWYANLADHGVTVWYTSPAALRMLMRDGGRPPGAYDLSALRHVASAGEPLHPKVVVWARDHIGRPVHDTWSRTETGAIMIANFGGVDIRPGSTGLPVPGIDVGLVDRDTDGRVRVLNASDVDGEVAIRAGWPSMFRGYLDGPAGTGIVDGWYLTGETARRDADGYFWFTASSTANEVPFPGAGAPDTGTGQTIAHKSGVRR